MPHDHIIQKVFWLMVALNMGGMGMLGPAFTGQSYAQDSVTPPGTSPPSEIYFAPVDEGNARFLDFAQLDYEHPLTITQRIHLTPEFLQTLSQEHLDQIYGRLTAGPIPDGALDGLAFLPQRHRDHFELARQILGKMTSPHTEKSIKLIQASWTELWKGKVFNRGQKSLQNRVNLKLITDIAPLLGEQFAQQAQQLPADSLLFPAKVYCGQSKLDSRRESIILDYAYTDDLPHYRDWIDYLAGRNGLEIRDELRMIRPGFYLGRAYMGKFFLINFTLMDHGIAQAWEQQIIGQDVRSTAPPVFQEECWNGRHHATHLDR
ncbi:MAG: hypothetical protein ABI618_02580 [Nitrospirota bacterium]